MKLITKMLIKNICNIFISVQLSFISNADSNNSLICTFVGNKGVGKTSIIKKLGARVTEDQKNPHNIELQIDGEVTTDNGEKFYVKYLEYDYDDTQNDQLSLQLKNSDLVFFIYSKDNENSYNDLKDFIINTLKDKDIESGKYYLIGNKSDYENGTINLKINNDLATFKSSHKIVDFDVSATLGKNIIYIKNIIINHAKEKYNNSDKKIPKREQGMQLCSTYKLSS